MGSFQTLLLGSGVWWPSTLAAPARSVTNVIGNGDKERGVETDVRLVTVWKSQLLSIHGGRGEVILGDGILLDYRGVRWLSTVSLDEDGTVHKRTVRRESDENYEHCGATQRI